MFCCLILISGICHISSYSGYDTGGCWLVFTAYDFVVTSVLLLKVY